MLRLTAAGGKHVVIANSADLGKTPFATAQARAAAFTAATRTFNDSLKIGLSNVTSNVLLIDNEAYINILYNSPSILGTGGTATVMACSTPVTSCTASNAVTDYALNLFADDRHIAPAAHRLLGDFAYSKIKLRW